MNLSQAPTRDALYLMADVLTLSKNIGEHAEVNGERYTYTARHAAGDVADLLKIARAIQRINECDCNGYRDEKSEEKAKRRGDRLTAEAKRIAERLGAKAIFQGDPRGAPLYLRFAVADRPEGREVCVWVGQ